MMVNRESGTPVDNAPTRGVGAQPAQAYRRAIHRALRDAR